MTEADDETSRHVPLLTVLVVDDDDLVRVNMAMLLEDLGHRTFAAASASEALDVLRRETNVDLVITDQAMPKTLGSQLAAMIEKEWPDLPVVIANRIRGTAARRRSGSENSPSPSRRPTSFGSSQRSCDPHRVTPT